MPRLVVAALIALLPGTAAAQGAPRIDVALVLAVDVSASIDQERYDLQREGFAAAFADPQVIEAVASGQNRAIAVTLVEWSGPGNQRQMIGWTLITDAHSARAFGAAIGESPRAFADFTSISGAVDFCVRLAQASGYEAARIVIDVSGDGSNNSGRPMREAREAAVAAGITINGLAILASEASLDEYYRDNVIGGDGAFVVVADDFPAFAGAILNKLVREIAGTPPPPFSVASVGP